MPLFKQNGYVYNLHMSRLYTLNMGVIQRIIPGKSIGRICQIILEGIIDHLVVSQRPLSREVLVVCTVISPVLCEVTLIDLPVFRGISLILSTAIGVALGSVVMWPLVRLVGGVDASGNVANPDKGFFTGAVIVAVVIIVLSLYHYFTTKERVRPQNVEKTSMLEAIKILFKRANFRRNVILDFLRSTIITATTGYGLYYATYVLGKPGMLTLLSAIYLFSSMLFVPFVGRIIRRLGIRKSLILSAVILIAAELVFVIMPKTLIGGIAVVFACGISTSLINVALSLNRAHIADEVEVSEGRRVDSMVSNVNGFAVKCGASLVGLLFGWILEFSHYDGSLSVQPDSAIKGIIFIMGWMVIICCAGLILAAPKDEPAKIAEATEGE